MARYRILTLCFCVLLSGLLALSQKSKKSSARTPTTFATGPTNSISFSFTIPPGPDTMTTAAVLDPNGVLVRTLWAGVSYPPGTYSGTWDGKLDIQANPTPGAQYTIKMLMNNVSYTYDGRVFSTDADWYGTHKWSWYCGWNTGLPRFSFAGTRGWAPCGYNEGTMNMMTFNESQPNYPSRPNVFYFAAKHLEADSATDGNWVYWLANMNSTSSTYLNNFVFATDATTGMPVNFSAGVPDGTNLNVWIQGPVATTYIDYSTGSGSGIPQTNDSRAKMGTGIAVQRNSATCVYPTCGNLLAVAHGALTTPAIKLFDKITGASAGADVTLLSNLGPNNTPMVFTSEGLWVITTDGKLNLITGLPNAPVVTQPITGLSFAVGVGANTATNNLFVSDGGTTQQVIEYAANTHAVMRRIGDAGSYNDCNPSITHTRLLLDNYPVTGVMGNANTVTLGTSTTYTTAAYNFWYSWVAADDNDNVWVQDQGGRRIEHFDANSNYVNQILYKHPVYLLTVSRTLPTRVFNDSMMEYTVDYTKPLIPGDPDPAVGGNGAWVLSKNWLVCAIGANGSPLWVSDMIAPYAVEQLSNGRVYAHMYSHAGGSSQAGVIWELPTNGQPARSTGVHPNAGVVGATMGRNGDFISYSNSGYGASRVNIVQSSALTGFDSSNNPLYGPVTTLASVNLDSTNQLLYDLSNGGYSRSMEPSTGGVYPVYSAAYYNNGIANGALGYSAVSPKFGTNSFSTASDTTYAQFLTIGSQAGHSWTMEAWLKTTSTAVQVAVGYSTSTGGSVWFGSSGGKFAFGVDGSNGFDGTTQVSGTTINDGNWHHCVLEMTDTNNVAGIQTASTYIDGVAGPTLTGTVNPPGFYPQGYIGRSPSTTGMAWTGNIDEVAIWNYPKWTANFSVPTAAYASAGIYGLVQLFHMDGGIVNPYGNPGNISSRYPHAAGMKAGSSTYSWTAMPEICTGDVPDYKGSYPCRTDGGYGGIHPIRTEGRNFFFHYGGNWTPWGAQIYHFYEDGMMIGQFGQNQAYPGGGSWTSGAPVTNIGGAGTVTLDFGVRPASMGNVSWITETPVNNGNDIYVYAGDEAVTTGHRFHVSNLNSIHEWAGTTALAPNAVATLTQLF